MSTFSHRAARGAALVLLLCRPDPAAAQSAAPPMRGDAHAVIGWQLADTHNPARYRQRERHSELFGGIGFGWHWTEHLKTEVDAGMSTESRSFRSQLVTQQPTPIYQSSVMHLSRRTVGIGQQYQFFRNAWFHPHVAAGANLRWERRVEHFEPLQTFDRTTGAVRILQPARTEGPRTAFTVRPYAATGFKAYMTPRTFFRADLRLGFRHGFDESLVRAGFGIDF